jgi:hypothetical protein
LRREGFLSPLSLNCLNLLLLWVGASMLNSS